LQKYGVRNDQKLRLRDMATYWLKTLLLLPTFLFLRQMQRCFSCTGSLRLCRRRATMPR